MSSMRVLISLFTLSTGKDFCLKIESGIVKIFLKAMKVYNTIILLKVGRDLIFDF